MKKTLEDRILKHHRNGLTASEIRRQLPNIPIMQIQAIIKYHDMYDRRGDE
ncbi:hypothetical protein APC1482_0626 [Bifidobacterium longum]|nr:hypothetical protein APC1482_0626 [Bifidobacterium longum]